MQKPPPRPAPAAAPSWIFRLRCNSREDEFSNAARALVALEGPSDRSKGSLQAIQLGAESMHIVRPASRAAYLVGHRVVQAREQLARSAFPVVALSIEEGNQRRGYNIALDDDQVARRAVLLPPKRKLAGPPVERWRGSFCPSRAVSHAQIGRHRRFLVVSECEAQGIEHGAEQERLLLVKTGPEFLFRAPPTDESLSFDLDSPVRQVGAADNVDNRIEHQGTAGAQDGLVGVAVERALCLGAAGRDSAKRVCKSRRYRRQIVVCKDARVLGGDP